MKERPIIFSAPMVRAILGGAKTQTRRVVKPAGWDPASAEYGKARIAVHPNAPKMGLQAYFHHLESDTWHGVGCPYGKPGERLWVREEWAPRTLGAWPTLEKHMKPIYRADEDRPEWRHIWKPSIHMPRWASRITLEVTGVRVERLQEISEADVIAEGNPWGVYLNSWAANPWVWVVEFRRLAA
jgi:hypothetical protein